MYKFLRIACLIFLTTVVSTSFAQTTGAQGPFFYGFITEGPGIDPNHPTIDRNAYFALHPSSLEGAKKSACGLMTYEYESSNKEAFNSCMSGSNGISCKGGGYFAIALQHRELINNQGGPPYEFKVVGISCGKKTAALAEASAKKACEESALRHGLPSGPDYYANFAGKPLRCPIYLSAKNNGLAGGKLFDYDKFKASRQRGEFIPGEFSGLWGADRRTEIGQVMPDL